MRMDAERPCFQFRNKSCDRHIKFVLGLYDFIRARSAGMKIRLGESTIISSGKENIEGYPN